MKMLIGTYNQNIYELEVVNNKFSNLKIINNYLKPSFLINDNPLSFIFNKDDIGYVSINNKEIKVDDTSCHISYDNKNKRHYISHYGTGKLSVITNDSIVSKITFKENSHIHYAEYINTLDLIGVVDLGENEFHLFNNNLTLNYTYKFDSNYGPRHFTFHREKPIIYLITEHIPALFVFKYENNQLILLEKHLLGNGHGSAIRIDEHSSYLYTAVRTSNMIFGFKILKDGLLKIIQKVHTYGNHPRDFNLSLDFKYLVALNMHSNNITLFKINEGKLYLLQKDFYLEAGASVIFQNN